MRPARNLPFLIFLVAVVAPRGIRGQSEPLPLCYAPNGIPPESCVSFFPRPSSTGNFEFPKYTSDALLGTRGGNIELSVIISESGEAEDIRVVKSLGKELDEPAIAALRQTRFNPGRYKGQVVPVRGTAVLHLNCLAYYADAVTPTTSDYTPAGNAKTNSHWKGPLADCGNDPKLLRRGHCAPILVLKTGTSLGEKKDSKLAEANGTVILSATIDEQGYPRDIRIVTPTADELNQRAIAMLQEWRFRPALHKGQPFKVRARLEVRFWFCALNMFWGLEP
jgi:TonB family protein